MNTHYDLAAFDLVDTASAFGDMMRESLDAAGIAAEAAYSHDDASE